MHKVFGKGTVIWQDEKYIKIRFADREVDFQFPNAFAGYLTIQDSNLASKIAELLTTQPKQTDAIRTPPPVVLKQPVQSEQNKKNAKQQPDIVKAKENNIAFKCNYCDGGRSENQVGFNGLCSENIIRDNIITQKRTWCSAGQCPCSRYLQKHITYQELIDIFNSNELVCYESRMLRDWKALAGINQSGKNKGKRRKLNQLEVNSLCVLTTRNPKAKENQRYIFAVFLIDNIFPGDARREGYVSASSHYKIKLSPLEAERMPFWKYYANSNNSTDPAWNTGLYRYLNNEQSAQILKDIAQIKIGTDDEKLASDFYIHYCAIKHIDKLQLRNPQGALKI